MRTLLAACLLIASAAASAESYLVEAKVWIDGDLRGEPSVLVESGTEATIEMDQAGSGWRMNVLVEPPTVSEGAASDAVWLRIDISEQVDGEWEFLTDSMLGLRAGQTGSFSVVGTDTETATPENARLYVELSAAPVANAAEADPR